MSEPGTNTGFVAQATVLCSGSRIFAGIDSGLYTSKAMLAVIVVAVVVVVVVVMVAMVVWW
jgi:hypothetical protein